MELKRLDTVKQQQPQSQTPYHDWIVFSDLLWRSPSLIQLLEHWDSEPPHLHFSLQRQTGKPLSQHLVKPKLLLVSPASPAASTRADASALQTCCHLLLNPRSSAAPKLSSRLSFVTTCRKEKKGCKCLMRKLN